MLKTARIIFSCLCTVLLLTGCSGKEHFTPGSGNTGGGSGTVTPPSGSADWTQLTASNHPRIIMTDADVEVIKQKIETDANLKKMHDYIIQYADRSLTMSDLEYKIESGRLLAVSQEAGERITACSYAFRMTGDTRYLERAEKDMQSVCAFPDWHTAHWLDTGELCFAVGIGYDWLYNNLSAQTRRQAETAIRGSLRVHDKRKPLNARRMPMHSFVSTPLQGTLDPME